MKWISLILCLSLFVNTALAFTPGDEEAVEDLDKLIRKAEKQNESLEKTIKRVSKELNRKFEKSSKKITRLLKRHKTDGDLRNFLSKKLKNPMLKNMIDQQKVMATLLTIPNLREEVRKTIDYNQFLADKELYLEKIKQSGSWLNYLMDLKAESEQVVQMKNNQNSRSIASDGSDIGTNILLIIAMAGLYVGIPLLLGVSIITLGWIAAGMVAVLALGALMFWVISIGMLNGVSASEEA